jgi:hypothetical protein
MNCNDRARTAPRTLEIRSLVRSRAGRCKVDAQGSASHDIEIKNWGGIAYSVDIHGKCQTPYVRYRGTDRIPQESWDQNAVLVQSSPGSGARPVRAAASKPLMSLGPARAQSINTDLWWFVPGWPASCGRESLGMQVDTL